MSNKGELVIILWVQNLELNKYFFFNLGFKCTDLSPDQFIAQLNEATIVIQAYKNGNSISNEKKGCGIELWFTVPNINTQYQVALNASIKISIELGNRGHSKQGDFTTITPDGYQIAFY